jgi:hypothetical protein
MQHSRELLNYRSSPPRTSWAVYAVVLLSILFCLVASAACALVSYGHIYRYTSTVADGWKLHWSPDNIWRFPTTYGVVAFPLAIVALARYVYKCWRAGRAD